ncbi:MAG: GTP cyclohydrolase FolE2 [Spirochaetia bacterium]
MKDVQSQSDTRKIPLQKVGVKGVKYPLTVLDKKYGTQRTVARVDLFADLPHHFKGSHMSRFIAVFNQYHTDLTMKRFLAMLESIRESLEAETAFAKVEFPYFMEKKAPVSGLVSMNEYQCSYWGEVSRRESKYYVGVKVPVTTVCPCSKEISDRGAHNQRGTVKVSVKLGPFFWIEDMIEAIESSASAPLYTLLKREDERYITETAYDNPVFVEDVVREVYKKVQNLKHFPWFSVEAENHESIHNHSAYAYAQWPEIGE